MFSLCTVFDCREFEDNLNYNCDNVDHELALMSLKALGNVGGTRNSAQVLSRCMMNPAVEMELRVEAVKAFRRIDCDVARTDVMTLYQDMTMDSELRIHAYLQLMKCPSRQVLVDIKQQMQSEEINQVSDVSRLRPFASVVIMFIMCSFSCG